MYNPNAPYRPMTATEQEESYAYRAIKQVSRPYKLVNYTRAYAAAAPACVDKKDGPLSGIAFNSCLAQKSLTDAINSTGDTLFQNVPGGSVVPGLKTGAPKTTIGVVKKSSNSGGGGTGASGNCGACNAGDIGCEMGKLSCEFTKALGDAGNSTGDWFGGGFDQYIPYILAAGGLVVLVMVLK